MYVVSDGYAKRIEQGIDLLHQAHRAVATHSCSGLVSLEEAPDSYELPPSQMWNTYLDPETGQVMASSWMDDVWDVSRFRETAGENSP